MWQRQSQRSLCLCPSRQDCQLHIDLHHGCCFNGMLDFATTSNHTPIEKELLQNLSNSSSMVPRSNCKHANEHSQFLLPCEAISGQLSCSISMHMRVRSEGCTAVLSVSPVPHPSRGVPIGAARPASCLQ